MGIEDALFVNPANVSDVLRCSVCLDVFEHPVFDFGGQCQHTFCYQCVHDALAVSASCPQCRGHINHAGLQPHLVVQSLIDELHVKCSLLCGWTGRFDSRAAHAAMCPVARLSVAQQLYGESQTRINELTTELRELEAQLLERTKQIAERDAQVRHLQEMLRQMQSQLGEQQQSSSCHAPIKFIDKKLDCTLLQGLEAAPCPPEVSVQMWEVIGGAGKGGIIVREDESTSSSQRRDLLETGSLIEEVELKGLRLKYKRRSRSGPTEGWISISTVSCKLAVKTSRQPRTAFLFNDVEIVPNGFRNLIELPAITRMFQTAKRILDWDVDIRNFVLNSSMEVLNQGKYRFPLAFIAGMSRLEKLKAENPQAVTNCSGMAGFAFGSYIALCAAGVISFEEGLKYVRAMGDAIQGAEEESTSSRHGVALVYGIEKEVLERFCREAATAEGPSAICQISYFLRPPERNHGFIIGGTRSSVDCVKVLCERAGALKVHEVPHQLAYHTPLAQAIQDKMMGALEDLLPTLQPPTHKVFLSSGRALRAGCDMKDLADILRVELTNNLTKPILWYQQVQGLIEEGLDEFYVACPGILNRRVRDVSTQMPRNTHPM